MGHQLFSSIQISNLNLPRHQRTTDLPLPSLRILFLKIPQSHKHVVHQIARMEPLSIIESCTGMLVGVGKWRGFGEAGDSMAKSLRKRGSSGSPRLMVGRWWPNGSSLLSVSSGTNSINCMLTANMWVRWRRRLTSLQQSSDRLQHLHGLRVLRPVAPAKLCHR